MENAPQGSPEKGGCCSSGSSCRCCGAKALAALVLLLIGGAIGYLMGRCGMSRKWAMYHGMAPCPMTAPAAPQSPSK